MDKTITTALLIIVSMVMVLMLFNIAYPAIVEGGDAITGMANRESARMGSQIAIIHCAGELDADGNWQDGNYNGEFEVFAWVKNTGDSRITALDNMDVFFGAEGAHMRIPHQSETAAYPYWTWQIENASDWSPTATARITVHYGAPLAQGRYFLRVTTANGIADDAFMGM